ncbi:universal stress protein [Agilicoccus flavus]|uniref:universal stress protein n=1 Tax=Agilicoccus flavus TaxID=2775968 RepID=UPI001CF6BB5D|nr:universal stress protein [Agilicoccus flavus]
MESVLIGVDQSDASTRAMTFGVERARRNRWKVLVVYVVNWNPFGFTTPEDNEHRSAEREKEIAYARTEIIAPMVALADEAGVECEALVHHGKPSQVMADLARDRGLDLIIVGRVGDSGLREAIFGSTASRLVQHASVPVMVVP